MVPTFGYPTLAMIGHSVLKVIHPDDLPDVKRALKLVTANPAQVITARWRIRRSDGEWAQTDNTLTNLMSDENIRGLVLTTRDVSARVSLEARLTHEAFHDPLTGLANRALFHNLAEEALARPRTDQGIVAVLFIDLDEFKDINDSFGHGFGDSLLKAAAQRLVSGLRPDDTAARLGGDEFAVLCDDPHGKVDVNALAERLALLFHSPFSVEGREVAVTASVGVAVALRDETTEELLRNADLAMYVAKSRGRRQAARFEPAMHSTLVEKVGLHADLSNAMANGELEMVYQPIHCLKTRELIGAEALMRWNHPKRGSIEPSIFIPSAEESGLIVPIGRWSLNQVCADAQRWRRTDPSMASLLLSVNVSGRQIRELTLVDDVQHALRTSGHEPCLLMLELTESMLLEDTESSVATMKRLKTTGVLLAIDDFGTGYSSLSYLQHLPIDLLKIDRAFVEHIELDRSSVAVARAITALATTMSLRTVAEGIETARQAELLLGLDCEFGQGFFYGKPMSSADFIAYARQCGMNAAA
jgi:diguanylate cyclase (GGDEF)-like protein/PAS domain S-box-containing protein